MSSTKRKRSASPPRTPDTASTVIVGSVNSNKTTSTFRTAPYKSPTNESYRTPSVSSNHYSQQASRGKDTATTKPHSVFDDGSYKYPSSVKEKSSDGPVSPMTPLSAQSRKRMRKNGGKKTTRKSKRTHRQRRRH